MPDSLTVTSKSVLKVGSPGNYVSFEITATQDLKNLRASITIPCGKKPPETYLCGDSKRASLEFLIDSKDKISGSVTKSNDLTWASTNAFSLNAGDKNKLTIKISGFTPERAGETAGKASLSLAIWNNPKRPFLHEKTHPVKIDPAEGVAIIFFDVSPTNVLRNGKVTISSVTTGAGTVKLYASDTASDTEGQRHIEPDETDQAGTEHKYSHTPQQETTYRLEAWQGKAGTDKETAAKEHRFDQRKVLVTVQQRSVWWDCDLSANSLRGAKAKQHFYPTLLLAAKDLSGEDPGATPVEPDKLYGIFVSKETKRAELWSSDSGLEKWDFAADVPDGMGGSPGVIHKQALWLVGGSSAEPTGPISNRVWWYYKDKENKMQVKEWDEEGSERESLAKAGKALPAPRRCHACAVFDNKLWVLGGLSENNHALDEVWTCSADPAADNFTPSWEKHKPLPSGRCLSAVAATPGSPKININGVSRPRLWLYGGVTHPYNIDETEMFDELLWTEDGELWVGPKDPGGVKLPGQKAGPPLGATLLYGKDGRLHLAGLFLDSRGDPVASDHDLADVTRVPPNWPKGSLSTFGWDFPRTELFLLGSVAFRERWILWPVYQDMDRDKDRITKHDARIYNIP